VAAVAAVAVAARAAAAAAARPSACGQRTRPCWTGARASRVPCAAPPSALLVRSALHKPNHFSLALSQRGACALPPPPQQPAGHQGRHRGRAEPAGRRHRPGAVAPARMRAALTSPLPCPTKKATRTDASPRASPAVCSRAPAPPCRCSSRTAPSTCAAPRCSPRSAASSSAPRSTFGARRHISRAPHSLLAPALARAARALRRGVTRQVLHARPPRHRLRRRSGGACACACCDTQRTHWRVYCMHVCMHAMCAHAVAARWRSPGEEAAHRPVPVCARLPGCHPVHVRAQALQRLPVARSASMRHACITHR
jgi:hypothetical protein